MDKRKQTPADRHGGRTERQPRDPPPERPAGKPGKPGTGPIDDLYGTGSEAVDRDLDLDGGTDGPPRH